MRFVAWPPWVHWENLLPHGRDLSDPPLQWRLLPADPEHPNWAQVVGERDRRDLFYVQYTFDRRRDWLCIRQEMRFLNRTHVLTVESMAQTSDGFWYPRQIQSNVTGGMHTYQYVVERGTADPGFFDYPDNAPPPVDRFAELLTQTQPTASAESGSD